MTKRNSLSTIVFVSFMMLALLIGLQAAPVGAASPTSFGLFDHDDDDGDFDDDDDGDFDDDDGGAGDYDDDDGAGYNDNDDDYGPGYNDNDDDYGPGYNDNDDDYGPGYNDNDDDGFDNDDDYDDDDGGRSSDCVIPDSGPWPPCARGDYDDDDGDYDDDDGDYDDDDCIVPASGPWPACATSGNSGSSGSSSSSNSGIREIYGVVSQRPALGLIGTWVIGGTAFEADGRTWFSQQHGSLDVGSCVEIKFRSADNSLIKVEAESAYECNPR